jgi:hypothetical protein
LGQSGREIFLQMGLDRATAAEPVGQISSADGARPCAQGWTKLRKFEAAVFLNISESFRTCMRGWSTVIVSCFALKMSAFYRSVARAVPVDMRRFDDMSSLRFIVAPSASLQMDS